MFFGYIEFEFLDFSFSAGDFEFCSVVHVETDEGHDDSGSVFWEGGRYPNACTRVVRWPNQRMLTTMTKIRFTRPAMLYATGVATLNNENAMMF